jgi:hypothetical protein
MGRQILTMTFLCAIVLVLCSCNQRGPDLVPERRTDSEGAQGFCRRDNQGNLVVRVRNQGNGDVVDPSTAIVVFTPGGPRSSPTAPMPAGSFTDVIFQIPSGCFNPDCSFTITVDANGNIDESMERNNTADGICIG